MPRRHGAINVGAEPQAPQPQKKKKKKKKSHIPLIVQNMDDLEIGGS